MSKRVLPAGFVLLLTLLLLATSNCVVRRTVEIVPTGSKPVVCADGAPVKVLQQPDCPDGVCGYTCAPERWKKAPPPESSK